MKEQDGFAKQGGERLFCAAMNSIEELFEPYARLESILLERLADWIGSVCGICTVCCCRADICEEALESAFLSRLLIKQGLDETEMSEQYGWLMPSGCRLRFGRPPICHAYFCDQLLARLPDPETREVISLLGMLPYHIGVGALGELHLTEIRDPADLERVDFSRLEQQLAEAKGALSGVDEFFRTEGRPSPAARAAMNKIPRYEL